jgi:hypothetical protein
MNKLPSDLETAREYFKKFENSFELVYFCEAFAILDEHIFKCDRCPHWEWIKNVKIAHSRILIRNLDKFGNWKELMQCLTLAKPHIDEIEDDNLRMRANEYIVAHAKDYSYLFKEQLRLGI